MLYRVFPSLAHSHKRIHHARMSSPSPEADMLRFLPQDIQNFLLSYPSQPQSSSPSQPRKNLEFYRGRIRMRPDDVTISQVHGEWLGRYTLLERKHGFIQWLFPIRERGVNAEAQPLSPYEIHHLTKEHQPQILKSFRLMLDFYGLQMDPESMIVSRSEGYGDRYWNLEHSPHNYLRISRILKCLAEMSLEVYGMSWMLYILVEQSRGVLIAPMLKASMDQYWSWCFRDSKHRDFLHDLLQTVEEGGEFLEEEYRAVVQRRLRTGVWERTGRDKDR